MTKNEIALNQLAHDALRRLELIESARTLEQAKRVTLAMLTLKWGVA